MTQALIDADLIAYRCAATCEEFETSEVAIQRCFYLTETILHSLQANEYTLYLTGSDNFRKKINPEYKANRKDKPRPKWLQDCREALVSEWQAKVTDGIEADDALGINQTKNTIICSLDKDLLQVPGKHYNWVKDEQTIITPEQGLKNFWMQTLVGDVADNIIGVRGLGPVKAGRILDQIYADSLEELNEAYYNTVQPLYSDDQRLHTNAACLWVLRHEADVWLAPGAQVEKPVTESIEAALKTNSQQP
jgi:5'-3' exonuclease